MRRYSLGHESKGTIGLIFGVAALAIGLLALAKIYGYYDIGIEEQTMYLLSAIGSAVAGITSIFASLKTSPY